MSSQEPEIRPAGGAFGLAVCCCAGLGQTATRALATFAIFAGLSLAAGVPQAQAGLILTSAIDISGTGLGAVNTITTAQDNGTGQGADHIESGCVGRSGGADVLGSCLFGLDGGDEQAINQTVRVGDFTDANGDPAVLPTLGDIVLVFNVNETGQDVSVVLDNLYFVVYDDSEEEVVVFSAELVLAQHTLTQGTGTGTGQSGFTFILDEAQYAVASAIDFTENYRVGGGFVTGDGTTNAGHETVFVLYHERVPEPATAILAVGGLAGIALSRRRRKHLPASVAL